MMYYTNVLIYGCSFQVECYNSIFDLFSEGCGRTPSQPSPPVTTPGPSENSTIPENHRLSCTENETYQTACLNGGSCFATYIEYRTIQCA